MSQPTVDVQALLEAGAHFGHKTSRWHPAMKPYIHCRRGDVYIIDLFETARALEAALGLVEKKVAAGEQVLFVATKRQAKDIVRAAAISVGMPYVTERWLGGMLTNQRTVSTRIKRLKDLEAKLASGELASKYNKLEVQRFSEEVEDMNNKFGGIKDMAKLPGVVYIIDLLEEVNAVNEAKKLGIPAVGLADTNADPRVVTHPIPCNDDAVKTIELITNLVVEAVQRGQARQKQPVSQDKK